ncbi:hypothetical protein DPEC_G00019060 [Dallia pectoralis]|uniref:Uncharacterized protein n=1 Tax=Dallia pectoralis TaxID=75939 RepID=A0ACC2HFL4_DALPE|nr:hypothetical protein DPEC_G00019060 [Dallia pectoralis]
MLQSKPSFHGYRSYIINFSNIQIAITATSNCGSIKSSELRPSSNYRRETSRHPEGLVEGAANQAKIMPSIFRGRRAEADSGAALYPVSHRYSFTEYPLVVCCVPIGR